MGGNQLPHPESLSEFFNHFPGLRTSFEGAMSRDCGDIPLSEIF
jgi:hypothetical protein